MSLTISKDSSNVVVSNGSLKIDGDYVYATGYRDLDGNDIGGGSTPTLELVTQEGATTTNTISLPALTVTGSDQLLISSTTATSVAIGRNAGTSSQSTSGAIAIGDYAGKNTQGNYAIAIGRETAENSQGNFAIAMGIGAGRHGQNNNCIAMSYDSGKNGQGTSAIAIGLNAGKESQSTQGIALGTNAGRDYQGSGSVAIGQSAGYVSQETRCVAVGQSSGQTGQNNYSVAVGYQAGQTAQGAYAIAIGANAGKTEQNDNTIILNATNSAKETSNASAFYVHPVRSATHESNVMGYTVEGEIIDTQVAVSTLGGGSTPTLDEVTAAGATTTNAVTVGDLTGGATALTTLVANATEVTTLTALDTLNVSSTSHFQNDIVVDEMMKMSNVVVEDSLSAGTISMDCKNSSYLVSNIDYSGTGTISTLNLTNFQTGGSYLVRLYSTNASGVDIAVSLTAAGDLTSVKTGYTSVVEVAHYGCALVGIVVVGTEALVSVSKYA